MTDEFWKFATTVIVGGIAPTVMAFFSYLKAKESKQVAVEAKTISTESKAVSVENNGAIKEVHSAINSRLDEWKKETREAAVAAAIAAFEKGVSTEKARSAKEEEDKKMAK